MVAEGRRMPIGAGVVVDRRRLLDLVDQMRAALPNEIKEADDILRRRDEIIARVAGDDSMGVTSTNSRPPASAIGRGVVICQNESPRGLNGSVIIC